MYEFSPVGHKGTIWMVLLCIFNFAFSWPYLTEWLICFGLSQSNQYFVILVDAIIINGHQWRLNLTCYVYKYRLSNWVYPFHSAANHHEHRKANGQLPNVIFKGVARCAVANQGLRRESREDLRKGICIGERFCGCNSNIWWYARLVFLARPTLP